MEHVSLSYYSETYNRRDFVAKTLEIFKDCLKTAKRISVKPGIVSSEPYPTTTYSEVLDTILSWLSGHEIIVGDALTVDAGRSDKIL